MFAGPRVIETTDAEPNDFRATIAVALLVVSARLVAVTVTFWALVIVAGAVYRPALEIVPSCGLIDHDAPVLPVPVTVAVNC